MINACGMMRNWMSILLCFVFHLSSIPSHWAQDSLARTWSRISVTKQMNKQIWLRQEIPTYSYSFTKRSTYLIEQISAIMLKSVIIRDANKHFNILAICILLLLFKRQKLKQKTNKKWKKKTFAKCVKIA